MNLMTPEHAATIGALVILPRSRVVLSRRKTNAEQGARARQSTPKRKEPRPPCAFLGSATGKQHKVGCVSTYLEEHFCNHPLREVVEINSRRGTQTRVLTPKAIPAGRCRDLEFYRGAVVACVDCPLYRAGLLPAPSGE